MCQCVDGCGECVPQLKKPTPHKHAALIKAWADGATIQCSNPKRIEKLWCDVDEPRWVGIAEYRIKPEPKPDVVHEMEVKLQASHNGP